MVTYFSTVFLVIGGSSKNKRRYLKSDLITMYRAATMLRLGSRVLHCPVGHYTQTVEARRRIFRRPFQLFSSKSSQLTSFSLILYKQRFDLPHTDNRLILFHSKAVFLSYKNVRSRLVILTDDLYFIETETVKTTER